MTRRRLVVVAVVAVTYWRWRAQKDSWHTLESAVLHLAWGLGIPTRPG